VANLHVEYAERRIQLGVRFTFSLFGQYSNPEYVHIHVICRVNRAEYVIRILVAVPQEYVNTCSTLRVANLLPPSGSTAPIAAAA